MTPATLILVRHGRTAHNAEGRFQGYADVPLDAHGEAQARALAAHLHAHGVRAPTIHASDLARAHATARALHERLGGTLSAHAALRELHMGDWEGQTFETLRATQPDLYRAFWDGHPDFRAPNGETPSELAERVHAHLTAHRPGAGETLVLVSHGVALSALLVRLLNLDYRETWAARTTLHDNTAYSTLTLDPESGEVLTADLARGDHLLTLA
ncbi:histidine phosphatase family protein [Deinococcus maricopensis]|uniref:Phosphoglycerate mutase n=1 Tax=Deinococcus maricopensis (strain DSM 21211 / LMG 22137 / NRRL B-23946 / LB-34) TaxID=709986 RepID=E8U8X0_DEIML|nr:histidine phosphatase family protein [Deinococcus maricopensis]ADV67509.1 Phosphoglycerate mutase [Deinococcus maricopensis DSM 21211]